MSIPEHITEYILDNPNRFISYKEIVGHIWGSKKCPDKVWGSLRVHMIKVKQLIPDLEFDLMTVVGSNDRGYLLKIK